MSTKYGDNMNLCVDECPSDVPFVLDETCVSACPSKLYAIQDYSGFKVCIGTCKGKLILDLDHFGHWQCVAECSKYSLAEHGSKCFRKCDAGSLQFGYATCGECDSTQYVENDVCVIECPIFYK